MDINSNVIFRSSLNAHLGFTLGLNGGTRGQENERASEVMTGCLVRKLVGHLLGRAHRYYSSRGTGNSMDSRIAHNCR